MKKTQWIALLQDIRKTLVSFLSIVLFVALGVAMFLGIKWNEPAVSNTVTAYLNEHIYHDFLLTFPYGFSDDAVETIAAMDGISMAEGAYSAYGTAWVRDERYVLNVQAVTANIDKATVLEGAMPVAPDEVGIEQQFADAAGIMLGDSITLDTTSEGKTYLKKAELTVTAFVEHPSYFARETSNTRGLCNIGDGTVDYYVLVAQDAFNTETYDHCFSQVLLRAESLEGINTFDTAYESQVSVVAEQLKKLGLEQAKHRCDAIVNRADTEIADAEVKIADAKTELENGKQSLADGKKQIADVGLEIASGRSQITEAEQEIAAGREVLEASKQKIADAGRELAAGERAIAENEKKLADAQAEYDKGLAEYESKVEAFHTSIADLQGILLNAGFSPSFQTAKSELEKKQNELKALHAKMIDLQEKLAVAAELLKRYQQTPMFVNPPELASLLTDLVEGTGFVLSPKMIEQIKNKIQETSDLLDQYSNDKDSLRPSEIETIEKICAALNFTTDVEGIAKLKQYFQNAVIVLDRYSTDPQSALTDDLELILFLMMQFDIALELSDAEALLYAKQAQLQESIQNLENPMAKIDEALAGIEACNAGEVQLAIARTELEDARRQITAGRQELRAARAKLSNGKAAFEKSKQDFFNAEKKISDGELVLSQKKTELADAEVQLEKAKCELPDAEQKVIDGETLLVEKEGALADAKIALAAFAYYDNWTILKRTDNPSYYLVKFYAVSSTKLCFSMALLFVFVGLMVCYTSVTRNVNEAQTITGVQKALGLRRREIIAHYLTYSTIAVILGAILGFLSGYFVIESIVNRAYLPQYALGVISNVFVLNDALAITAVELLLILIATWLPCRKLLKRQAVELLRGEDYGCGQTRFYEKTKLWNRLSLYTQTTVNNLVNDGARVLATLVGVSGCTALIVMSLSLHFSISETPVKHFSNVWVYDESLVMDQTIPDAQKNLMAVLDRASASYAAVLQEAVFIEDESGELVKADMIAPETTENQDDFIRLNHQKTKKRMDIPENGAIISRTYEKNHDVTIGDTLRLMDTGGKYHACKIVGVSEHYLQTVQLTMRPEYYAQIMGKPAVSNTLYINYGDGDRDELREELKKTEGYFLLTDVSAKWTAVFTKFSGTTMLIVYISLFLSATMALLVLLNLNIVCVNEKSNELIIMRINGFSIGAVKKYIYRDNIVLTALGMIAGVAAGLGLGIWVLGILERKTDNFYTVPNPIACLISIGLTVLFALISNLVALHKIDKLKVSDLKRV